ncbi:MAG: NADPH-flavin oxidoreductase [Desulfovibrio sp.]|nr:NADPH-flavin oxidoreductase [Desulfovibrio sp.]
MEKINIGKQLALYPSVVAVVGALVDGKVNWMTVAHTGTLGHSMIMVSMNQDHYTNKGVIQTGKMSLNLVDRAMLPKVDYVGTVSGARENKSGVFAYRMGANGTPIIDESPVSIELDVVDNYKADGFDNFLCSIANTYARQNVLNKDGKLNYNALKPVLFEFPTYSYLATGEMLGKCRQMKNRPSMGAKLPMTESGITRLSKIEVYPQYLDEYKKIATEVGEISLRVETGVLTMYAVADKENPNLITILETYASKEAYDAHIASPHFQKYKQGALKMVKNLILSDQIPLNENNKINNYMIISE